MYFTNLIKRKLKITKEFCEVYDTCALIHYFDDFKKKVKEHQIYVVVPEGVLHEISVGRRKNEICKVIYDYIRKARTLSSKLIVEVTADKIRNWSVDEQVVYVACKYKRRGYDTTVVSCDMDLCFRAELKKVKTDCLLVPRNVNSSNSKVNNKSLKKPVSFERAIDKFALPSIILTYVLKNNKKYILLKKYLEIYDKKGRRKIGKDGYIHFEDTDKIYFCDSEYKVAQVKNNQIIIEKMAK